MHMVMGDEIEENLAVTMDALFVGPDFFKEDSDLMTFSVDKANPYALPLALVDKEFQQLFPPLHATAKFIEALQARRLQFLKKAILHEEAWNIMARMHHLVYYQATEKPDELHPHLLKAMDRLFTAPKSSHLPPGTYAKVRYDFDGHEWQLRLHHPQGLSIPPHLQGPHSKTNFTKTKEL